MIYTVTVEIIYAFATFMVVLNFVSCNALQEVATPKKNTQSQTCLPERAGTLKHLK